MRIRTLSAALLAVVLPISSCSDNGLLDPAAAPAPLFNHVPVPPPEVRISEIHYDNVGTDAGERIEVSAPAGTNLTGWSIVLYNGSNGQTYATTALPAAIPPGSVCGSRGVVFLSYAVNGIQNDNEGIALVNPAQQVVEFLSYEGSVTATNGPAVGLAPTPIAVRESGSEPVGWSIKRRGTGANVWEAPAISNFGQCNDNDVPPAAVNVVRVVVTPDPSTVEQGATLQFTATAYDASDHPVAVSFTWKSADPSASVTASGLATGLQTGDARIIATYASTKADTATLHVIAPQPPPSVRFTEIHYDNFGTDLGEAVEIEGPAGTDVTGWTLVLYNGSGGLVYDTRILDGLIPATTACNGRGVLYETYATDGVQNGAPDGMALVDAGGTLIEFLSYEGSFTAYDGPAAGRSSKDIVAQQASAPLGQSLQRNAAGSTWASATASFGVCNGTGVTPPPFGNSISFSGRVATDPPLPVGFEDQVFATLRDGSGNTVQTTFTWTSETPAIASIDQDGVMRALSAGTAVLRATAQDGTTRTYPLPTHVATASVTADYEGNAEFGEPEDATPADELIIRRNQLITSFNVAKGTPNWVAYEIDASHFGPQDRCDCFTYDPELPQSARYTTADYTGAGTFHGYGIDRGHLARSFDRTSGSLDNAFTYYFSNIIPQAADNNQGPWAQMENYLGSLAQTGAKEVYVIAGPQGNKGTIKNEGMIVIPTNTWKVAVIMPKDQGIESVNSYDDVEVIAVIMPNEAGIRNVPWETYKRTVDQVEALTGYNLLALLRDDIEIAVESNSRPPVAAVDGPFNGVTGEPVAMSAGMSTDPDGDALTYAWRFGDGGTGNGVGVQHTYAARGTFTVRLIVTDTRGLADTVETSASITARPVAATNGPYTGIKGEPVAMSGAQSSDADGDALSYSWAFGDGATATGVNVSHVYNGVGTFSVTLTVTDTRGYKDQVTTTATITARPVAAVDGPYTGIQGEAIAMSAAQSSDADGDALTYAWRFGDGGSATGVNVSHTYTSGGTFTVRLIVTDIRGLADTVETTAAIASWTQATGSAGAIVGQLAAAGKLNRGEANSLQAKLDAAEASFDRGSPATAVNQLEAFIHELDAMIRSGRLSAADAGQLRTLVTRIMAAAS